MCCVFSSLIEQILILFISKCLAMSESPQQETHKQEKWKGRDSSTQSMQERRSGTSSSAHSSWYQYQHGGLCRFVTALIHISLRLITYLILKYLTSYWNALHSPKKKKRHLVIMKKHVIIMRSWSRNYDIFIFLFVIMRS